MAEEHDLLLFHTQKYLEILKRADSGQASPKAWTYGLGSGDNPVFPGLYEWSLLVTGATLDCIRQILDENMQIAANAEVQRTHLASAFAQFRQPLSGMLTSPDRESTVHAETAPWSISEVVSRVEYHCDCCNGMVKVTIWSNGKSVVDKERSQCECVNFHWCPTTHQCRKHCTCHDEQRPEQVAVPMRGRRAIQTGD